MDSLVALELQEAWDPLVKPDQRELLDLTEIQVITERMVLLADVDHAV